MQRITVTKTTNQRKRRNNNKVNLVVDNTPRRRNRPRRRQNQRSRQNQNSRPSADPVSAAGRAFLKCTLAPADFAQVPGFRGIPDQFDGSIIVKNCSLTSALPTYTAGQDVYLLQAPIPGVAFFYGTRAGGSTGPIILTPVQYDSLSGLFPAGNEDLNVTSFRYASNVLEVIPTTNDMTVAGSIQVWKTQLEYTGYRTTLSGTLTIDMPVLIGLSSLNQARPTSVFPFREGAYTPSFNTEATYDWTPVLTNVSWNEINANQVVTGDADNFVTFDPIVGPFVGIGGLDCTIIKIPAAPAGQTAIIRSWACLECQVPSTSMLYEYRVVSPAYDPIALALLKKFHAESPTSVVWKDNATFWENFSRWARTMLRGIRYVPGPLGVISQASLDIMDGGLGF